jgi:SAM-dependent methyltransferase
MTNTADSFRDKWEKNTDLAFSETLREGTDLFSWILNRNGFSNPQELARFLESKRRVLDAGCGNGRVTALLRQYSSAESTEIVGIDLVSSNVARKNLGQFENVFVYERDLLGDLSDLGEFDFVYCQEVLHHTEDPQAAFHNLCNVLAPGGEIAIYVYKKKAPAREFVDDYIREKISNLPYAEAIAVCEQITELGKSLSEYKLKIDVPQVDVLEIPAGEYDLQRFIYHFFAKCFWNPELSYRDNVTINYDWYHPQLSTRHTLDEVREWFSSGGLRIIHEFEDFYGITVRGTNKG